MSSPAPTSPPAASGGSDAAVSSLTDGVANLSVAAPPATMTTTATPSSAPSASSTAASSSATVAATSKPSKKHTLESLASRIGSGEFRRILVLTGAGLSVSAGIPDFRTPGTGLYDNLAKYSLPHPTAVFEIGFFRRNPAPFFALAKELYPTGQYRPTPAHFLIRLLEERGVLLRNFTQNIDGLEAHAGLTPSKLIQAHGGFSKAECIDCRKTHDESHVKDAVFSDRIPRCTSCDGLVKPCITFFGEGLPAKFGQAVVTDFPRADLLIVMGTSLKVQPFASLIERVGKDVPRLLINNEAAGEADGVDEDDIETALEGHEPYQQMQRQLARLAETSPLREPLMKMIDQMRARVAAMMRGGSGGFNFKAADSRDVFHQSDCDTGCRQLAAAIGKDWAERLEQLVANDRIAHPPKPTTSAASNAGAKIAQAVAGAADASSSPPTTADFAVGFDFDHTLGLDHGLEYNAVQNYFRSVFHLPAFTSAQKAGVEAALREFRDGRTDFRGLLDLLLARFGLTSESDRARVTVEGYQAACFALVEKTTPLGGARELLRWLKARGVPTAILTNGWSPLQQKKVAHALGDDAPETLLVSDQLKGVKPSAEAFDALAQATGFAGRPRDRIVYVGDNPLGDVVGAIQAGLLGVWMDWEQAAYPENAPKPTHTIHALDELRPYLESLMRTPKL